MKRMVLVFVMVLVTTISLTTVQATPFSAALPGGKNYIDIDNFYVSSDWMESIDDIRVLPNTDYTFSFAPLSILDDPYVRIDSDVNILDGDVSSLMNCETEMDRTYCSFTTTSSEFISIDLSAQGLSQYVQYYGMFNIQLEEGTSWTEYEPYQPGYLDVNGPEFMGTATIIKAYYETLSIADIVDAHIIVLDEIDGDITEDIEIVTDPYTANMYQTGQYQVELEASDSSGNTSSMILTIIVKDEVAPLINGPESVDVSVDDTPLLEDLIADQYTITDGHDGPLEYVITSDNYSLNRDVTGTYSVTLYTEDEATNSITRSIDIHVVDMVAPQLLSNPTIDLLMSNPVSLTDIVLGLEVTDNYDDPSEITIDVIYDEYSTNQMVPGTYSVEIELTDQAGNTTLEVLTIQVADNIAPTISGPQAISMSYASAPTLEDILSDLTLSDNVDSFTVEDLAITSDNYSIRTVETGTYHIDVELADSAGNMASYSIVITLLDDQAPTIYIDNYLITVSLEASFTPEDALRMMIDSKQLDDDVYTIETVEDNYTENQDKSGTYSYKLRFTNSNGESIERDFLVRVTDFEQQASTIPDSIRFYVVYGVIIGIVIFVFVRGKNN